MKQALRLSEAIAFPGADTAVRCDTCFHRIDVYNSKDWPGLYEEPVTCWECAEREAEDEQGKHKGE